MSKLYFVSEHPDVIASHDESLRRYRAYLDKCEWFRDRFPDHQLFCFQSSRGHALSALVGECPGDAWRRKADGWVPYRNHQRDDELVERWDDAKFSYCPLPGMPSQTLGLPGIPFEGRTFSHGWKRLGDVLWVMWGCGREMLGDHVDTEFWAEAKPSAFHLAVEAAEESAEENMVPV